MREAFIIMQIGNADLDHVCDHAIVPALEACGLDARRIDRHNTGDLLKSEIVASIERAEILIADLTNERPNCYLEVGYAMGLGKKPNLILTAREDHFLDSPNHIPGGPKIHFDLSGYDILFWSAGDLDAFRAELEKRVRRRLAIVSPTPARDRLILPWDDEWLAEQRSIALPGLRRVDRAGYMELSFCTDHPNSRWTPRELLDAARSAEIHAFGWPIGIVLDRDEMRPRPYADGIRAEVEILDSDFREASWDYWSLRDNGDFYLLHTLFEDQRRQNSVFFDSRIVRVTESLLYCARLYSRLGLSSSTRVHFRVRHGGLRGRVLSAADQSRLMHWDRTSAEDEIAAEVEFELERLDAELVDHVKALLEPLFGLFDFFELDQPIWDEVVNRFVATIGK